MLAVVTIGYTKKWRPRRAAIYRHSADTLLYTARHWESDYCIGMYAVVLLAPPGCCAELQNLRIAFLGSPMIDAYIPGLKPFVLEMWNKCFWAPGLIGIVGSTTSKAPTKEWKDGWKILWTYGIANNQVTVTVLCIVSVRRIWSICAFDQTRSAFGQLRNPNPQP